MENVHLSIHAFLYTNMPTSILFATRDEITRADLAEIMCFQADGNYVKMITSSGRIVLLLISMQNVEQIIEQCKEFTFVRAGRSLMVNPKFILNINNIKKTITLGNDQLNSTTLHASSSALYILRQYLLQGVPLKGVQPNNGCTKILLLSLD